MRQLRYYWPAILVAAILFGLSSLPSSAVPSLGIKYEDLVMHFGAYSVFGFTLGLGILHEGVAPTRKRIFLALLIGLLYGISDEFHQSFVPGRQSTVSDVIADTLGCAFGVYVYLNRVGWLKRLSRQGRTA